MSAPVGDVQSSPPPTPCTNGEWKSGDMFQATQSSSFLSSVTMYSPLACMKQRSHRYACAHLAPALFQLSALAEKHVPSSREVIPSYPPFRYQSIIPMNQRSQAAASRRRQTPPLNRLSEQPFLPSIHPVSDRCLATYPPRPTYSDSSPLVPSRKTCLRAVRLPFLSPHCIPPRVCLFVPWALLHLSLCYPTTAVNTP